MGEVIKAKFGTTAPRTVMPTFVVVRYVSDLVRQEFINCGIVLYDPATRFVRSRLELDFFRILSIDPRAEMDRAEDRFRAFSDAIDHSQVPMVADPQQITAGDVVEWTAGQDGMENFDFSSPADHGSCSQG
jgi:hypothetical protein